MMPTIGRIVHYQKSGEPLAALITAVNEDGTVNLAVFSSWGSTYPEHRISDAAEPTAGHWNWPPRT